LSGVIKNSEILGIWRLTGDGGKGWEWEICVVGMMNMEGEHAREEEEHALQKNLY
jgi:hypothetical protein